MNKARMNFFKKHNFYSISLVFFIFLFLTLSFFGSPKKAASKENDNHFPPLSLIGVIFSKNNSSSVAVLQNEKTGRVIILAIGESISDLKLIRVFKNRILVQEDEKTFQIFLGRSHLVQTGEKVQKSAGGIIGTNQKDHLLGSNQLNNDLIKMEFIRSNLEKRIISEWPLIIKETQFVPNYVDGKIRGFKITKLPEKSIISKIGIYKNDVIKEVNGVELNDMATLFGLYNELKDKNQCEVSLERNGKLFRILYILKMNLHH